FLLDEAPGSLMASLRQRRLAGDVALNWLYQDRHLGWLLAVSSQPALWRCPLIALSDNVTLMREFLLDEAPGSLMASLRQRRLAGDVALNWLYQDRH
ncbi:hypothetical protein CQA67_32395, partial [Klebsiella pneumoniae]